MFIGPCIIVIVEEYKTNLMSRAILFHFLCAQHVSEINISLIRSLRLFCWITTLVVLFLVRCVLEFRCGWVGVVSMLQAVQAEASACNTDTTPTQPHRNSNTHGVSVCQTGWKRFDVFCIASFVYGRNKICLKLKFSPAFSCLLHTKDETTG